MLEECREGYSHDRPSSTLTYLTPVEFATRWYGQQTQNSLQGVDR